jgi:hypothetical protein
MGQQKRAAAVLAAAGLVAAAAAAVPATADAATSRHGAHVAHLARVAHLRHGLRVLERRPASFWRHLPVCVEEDGSGQWACKSGPQEGVRYVAYVVAVMTDGQVVREFDYADGGVDTDVFGF